MTARKRVVQLSTLIALALLLVMACWFIIPRPLPPTAIINKHLGVAVYVEDDPNGTITIRWRDTGGKGGEGPRPFANPQAFAVESLPLPLAAHPIEARLGRLTGNQLEYSLNACANTPVVYLRVEENQLHGYLGYGSWHPGPLGPKSCYIVSKNWWSQRPRQRWFESTFCDQYRIVDYPLSTPRELTPVLLEVKHDAIRVDGSFYYYLIRDDSTLGMIADKDIEFLKLPAYSGYWLVKNPFVSRR